MRSPGIGHGIPLTTISVLRAEDRCGRGGGMGGGAVGRERSWLILYVNREIPSVWKLW